MGLRDIYIRVGGGGPHSVTCANHYCIMLVLTDSLEATSIGSNARHHQPESSNQSDIAFYKTEARVLLRACKKLPYWSDNFRWYALIGSKTASLT